MKVPFEHRNFVTFEKEFPIRTIPKRKINKSGLFGRLFSIFTLDNSQWMKQILNIQKSTM